MLNAIHITPEISKQLDKYPAQYETDPFIRTTIKDRMKVLETPSKVRRNRWCEMIENIIMRHSSRKA